MEPVKIIIDVGRDGKPEMAILVFIADEARQLCDGMRQMDAAVAARLRGQRTLIITDPKAANWEAIQWKR